MQETVFTQSMLLLITDFLIFKENISGASDIVMNWCHSVNWDLCIYGLFLFLEALI